MTRLTAESISDEHCDAMTTLVNALGDTAHALLRVMVEAGLAAEASRLGSSLAGALMKLHEDLEIEEEASA